MRYSQRIARILALTVGLYVLSQAWAQMAMEISFPYHFKFGQFDIVIFHSPDTEPEAKTAGD